MIPGQPIRLALQATNHGASEVTVTHVDIAGFDAPSNCAPGKSAKETAYTCTGEAHVPKNAKPTAPYFSDNYWKHPENQAIQIFDPSVPFGVPFAPTPFRVTFHVKAGDVEVTKELPIEYRYTKDIYFGDKRMELNVVPAFSVQVTPSLAVIPLPSGNPAKPTEREVHVTVTNGTKAAAQANVALELPAGWKINPATVSLSFAHEDESLSGRFLFTAPAQINLGEVTVRAVVTSPVTGEEKFTTGYHEIEYPHVQRRQVMAPAEIALKVVDVKTVTGLNVGYIIGVGDQVPPALEQLGAKVSYIDQDELAWGDLSKHDVIMTGVRAYERRADLRAYNRRLLDYVERGGTVIVQYNKMEFNQGEYGPFPAKVSGNRVTDESAPVKLLAPADPVFNFPNKIGAGAWAGWVQERGLYFLGDKDPKYIDLVSMADSFKDNPGEKLGSLVEGKFGKGRWIYLGLGLWRQLPAGTDGAYQLLANLISLPKAPGSVAGLPQRRPTSRQRGEGPRTLAGVSAAGAHGASGEAPADPNVHHRGRPGPRYGCLHRAGLARLSLVLHSRRTLPLRWLPVHQLPHRARPARQRSHRFSRNPRGRLLDRHHRRHRPLRPERRRYFALPSLPARWQSKIRIGRAA